MHAVTISEPGGPEALTWSEVPDPAPDPGEVLIDVAASAVNRADLLQRAGYPGAAPCAAGDARTPNMSRQASRPTTSTSQ